MIELTEADLKTVKASLKTGYGLTKASAFILKHVKDLSELIRNDPDFKTLCEDCIKVHVQALLATNQSHLMNMDFDKYIKQNAHMTRHICKLTLWEEYTTKKTINPELFIKAMYLYKYPEEVATACGFDLSEMYDYIKDNEVLVNYVSKTNWIS